MSPFVRILFVIAAALSLWAVPPMPAFADPVTNANAAEHVAAVSTAATTPFQAFVDLLKAGGPLSAAVLMGWFALKKDKEAAKAVADGNAQFREIHDQMVGLVSQQTAAMVKMDATITALAKVVESLERRLE